MPFHVYYIPERLEQGLNPWVPQMKPVGTLVAGPISPKQFRLALRACFDLNRQKVPLEQVQADTAKYFSFLKAEDTASKERPQRGFREKRPERPENETLQALRQKIAERRANRQESPTAQVAKELRQKVLEKKAARRRTKDEV